MVQHNERIFRRWRKLIREYNVSELTPIEFCKKKNISRNTFYSWRQICNEKQSAISKDTFLEVDLKDSSPEETKTLSNNGCIQIVFNDRFKIAIADDFNEATLLKLINVLIESLQTPNHYYSGYTESLKSRLAEHNYGHSPHTSKI